MRWEELLTPSVVNHSIKHSEMQLRRERVNMPATRDDDNDDNDGDDDDGCSVAISDDAAAIFSPIVSKKIPVTTRRPGMIESIISCRLSPRIRQVASLSDA